MIENDFLLQIFWPIDERPVYLFTKKVSFKKWQCEHRPDQNLIATIPKTLELLKESFTSLYIEVSERLTR